jgi:hypothetical protein
MFSMVMAAEQAPSGTIKLTSKSVADRRRRDVGRSAR